MTLLAIFVAILVGAPILLTISALFAVIPFFILGAIGAFWFGFENNNQTILPRTRSKSSDFTPSIRFRLRQVNSPWSKNVRTT